MSSPFPKPLPDRELLLALFRYDPEEGRLYWTRDSRVTPRLMGRRAENKAEDYFRVWVGGESYPAHCVIWKMVHGKDPVCTIDHRNRVKSDNRISNLREADYSDQSCNRAKLPTCCIEPRGKRFRVRIAKNNVRQHIGVFDTIEEAEVARSRAYAELHGEFATL